MKILLVNPPLKEEERRNPVIGTLFANAMPLGLGYVAAVLIENGITDVSIVDAAAEYKSAADIVERVRRDGVDLVGIGATTYSYFDAIDVAVALKKAFGKSVPVVLGGPHISAIPSHAMDCDAFDYGVLGEGEHTFLELVQTLARGEDPTKVAGIVYRRDEELVFTARRPLVMDLDTIPFPARHLFKTHLYASLPTDVRYLPKFTQIPTRGCPFQCNFCDSAAVTGKKYRAPSPKYLVDEMEHMKKDFGVREVAFAATTFTVSHKKTHQFLDELEARKLNMAWTASTRVDVVDRDLLFRMKEMGCWSIRMGIESGNDDVLKFIQRGMTTEEVSRVVHWADEAGMQIKAFFIIGHLTDTPATIKQTIDFACSLPLDDVTVQINTPLPNTPQFKMAPSYGTLNPDFSQYNFWRPVFVPHGMSHDELLWWHKEFYKRFYWRTKTIKAHIRKKLCHWHTFVNYVKTFNLFVYLAFKREQPGFVGHQ
ncbi:MAG: radical SAM protein [Armatimonadetes bacterium]|nr:radical SAM protein [Armatimonadota bacterium]